MCLEREKIPIKDIDKRIGYVVVFKEDNEVYSSYCKNTNRRYKKDKKYKATFAFRDILCHKRKYIEPSLKNTGGFYGFKYKIHAKKWKGRDYQAKVIKCLFENVVSEGYQLNTEFLAFRAKHRTILEEV